MVIIGEGDMRKELEETAGNLGIASRVRFAGGRKRTEKFYRLARLFVLPSLEEPFGQVFLEAMASRLPCLGLRNRAGLTRVASEEIISDRRDGFIIEPDDPDQLAEKIDLLLNDNGLREKMGEAGRKKAVERFSWDTHFDRVLNL